MSDTSFSVAKFLSSKKSMLQSLFDKFTSKGEQENSVGYVEIILYKEGGGVLVYCWKDFNTVCCALLGRLQ